MRNQFADVLYETGRQDDRIVALVADISPAGSMVKFREEFPDRFVNVGVAEQALIGIAAGLALRGFRPFAYTIATFSLYRPFEMIRVDLAYQNLPVTVIGMGAGVIYSTLGGTHHTMEDIAVASAIPNMTVLAPCDPAEMRLATQWCARDSQGPVYMRLGKAGEPDLTSRAIDPFEIGRIRRITAGTGTCILSYGITVAMALDVAARIEAATGVAPTVACVHTIKPLDIETVTRMIQTHDRVVIIEEHVPHGGLSSRIKEIACDMRTGADIRAFTLQDRFIHLYGGHAELLAAHGLEAGRIAAALGAG